MTKNDTQGYQTLSAELDGILSKLAAPDVAVDEAVKLYEQGTKLVQALEKHVAAAENTLEKVRVSLAEQE